MVETKGETMPLNNISPTDNPDEYINMIEELMREGKKISLIKEMRAVSGLGLKDTKELIEKYETRVNGNATWDDDLIDEFKYRANISPDPYTKEELLNALDEAIDGASKLHIDDMLDAVEMFCTNIRKKGGLKVLAKERDRFLRKI